MNGKIISLVAIAIAVVFGMGTAYATYIVDTNINIEKGFAYQKMNIEGFKENVVYMGNLDVKATCKCPKQIPKDIDDVWFDKKGRYLKWDPKRNGGGEIHTYFVRDSELKQFYQKVNGTDVGVSQKTYLKNGNKIGKQELVVATDGKLEWAESITEGIPKCDNYLKNVTILQSAKMDVKKGKSMVFHKFDVPFVKPKLDLHQYVAAPKINFEFTFAFPKP